MNAWTIITAVALVAAIPMAIGATPEGCDQTAPQDQDLVSPLDEDMYFVVSDMEHAGIWREANHNDGLQTVSCTDGVVTFYEADERVDGLFLM